tara:strand:+ start:195 stop:752 length:558 start_codon:yes stop_codon:yes gene_type:complete
MEIEQLRQEINDLLENVVEHSNSYTAKEHLSSLDVSFILKKVNTVQESLTVLKYLLEVKHDERGKSNFVAPVVEVDKVIAEETISEMPIVAEETQPEDIEEETPEVEDIEQSAGAKLSDSLTLNDRYLFANELCNKDMNSFNELVKSIDSCLSLDEATKLYSTMDWEIDNEHVVTFTSLVERRFF